MLLNLGIFFLALFCFSGRGFAGENQALDASHVPGLTNLLNQLAGLDMNASLKAKLIEFVSPTDERTYVKATKSDIPADQYEKIRDEYARLMKIPPSQVVLFAFTDAQTRQTLLMPDFFRLTKASEQAAILLHESLWLQIPQKNYADVIEVEQAAQAFFETPNNPKIFYTFHASLATFFGNPFSLLWPTLQFDRKNSFPWLEPARSGVLLGPLLGEKYLRCYFIEAPVKGLAPESCGETLMVDLALQAQQVPNSLFLKALIENLHFEKTIHLDVDHLDLPGCDDSFTSVATYCRHPNFPNLDVGLFKSFLQSLFMRIDSSTDGPVFSLELRDKDPIGVLSLSK